jgi:hypothetical protein
VGDKPKDYFQDYYRMRDRWEATVCQPLPDEIKREACLAILREFIDQKAVYRIGQENAQLRLYADMLVLRSHLSWWRRDVGELCASIHLEMCRAVDDWLRARVVPGRHATGATKRR